MTEEFPLFSVALSLFLLLDALGNIPIFLAILKEYPPRKQKWIIFREMLIALGVITLFYFIGNLLLNFLHVQHSTVLIAGGIILFLIALRLIFPELFPQVLDKSLHHKEPFVVPLAIPLVAGPAVLATMMLYSKQDEPPIMILSALFLAWLVSTLILLSASSLQKILGKRGLTACERLMGLILILISVQMFLEGISSYLPMRSAS